MFAAGTHDDKSRGKCDALQRALDKVDASQKLLCLNRMSGSSVKNYFIENHFVAMMA